MITGTADNPLGTKASRLWKLATAIGTACVLLGSTYAGAAPTASEEAAAQTAIEQKLGKSIQNATADEIVNATDAAVNDPSVPTTVKTATLIEVALKYAPRRAPDLAQIGLNEVESSNTADRATQTRDITSYAMNAALSGRPVLGFTQRRPGKPPRFVNYANKTSYAGANDPGDAAAAITAAAVNEVKQSADANLLDAVVAAAVHTAAISPKSAGATVINDAAAGALVGAISQVAGSDNSNLNDSPPSETLIGPGGTATTNDALVKRVVQTAAQNAPNKIKEIATAAGYGLAGTYVATSGAPIPASDFSDNNKEILAQAIEAGLNAYANTLSNRSPKRGRLSPRAAFALQVQKAAGDIRAAIDQGIALAYAGLEGPGREGTNDFAYNNGQGQPVTDVQGL
jgi:hypothetical protein